MSVLAAEGCEREKVVGTDTWGGQTVRARVADWGAGTAPDVVLVFASLLLLLLLALRGREGLLLLPPEKPGEMAGVMAV